MYKKSTFFWKLYKKCLQTKIFYAKMIAFNKYLPKWRNGRRTGLKIPRGQLHEGSTPSFGTREAGVSSLFFRDFKSRLKACRSDRDEVAPGLSLTSSLAKNKPLACFFYASPPRGQLHEGSTTVLCCSSM